MIQSGAMLEIENSIKPPFNDLFGVEVWRYDVWGSKVLEEIGCKILTSLKITDIYAEQELHQLEFELLSVKRKIKEISEKLKVDKAAFLFRIENAIEAIRVAKEYTNGGVFIG